MTALGTVSWWLFILLVSTSIIRFVLIVDSNKRVYNHTPGPCRIVQGIDNGSAAIEYLPQLQLAFISNGLGLEENSGQIGRILAYEVKTGQRVHEAIPLQIEESKEFSQSSFAPLGLSSFTSKGRVSLYVVNAHPKRKCVEVFTFIRDKMILQHRKSICDSRLSSPIDIAVVGADRFFITNLAFFSKGSLQNVELSFQSNFGSLLLYDGHSFSYVNRFHPSPTGLVYDKERSRLVVASLMNEDLSVYSLQKDLSIVHKTDIALLSSPSGVFIDPKSGDILTALHPVLYSLYLHWTDDRTEDKIRSPSQVLRIRIQEDGVSWVITEPYANDGATISGSNSVLFVEDQLLIGSLFGRLLHCDVDHPQLA